MRCGFGSCSIQSEGHHQNSLLGPEFVEYVDHPPVLNHEMVSVASELSRIAWLGSGLQTSGTSMFSVLRGQVASQEGHV